MTENELKKLGRNDLLQMLIDQSKELIELKEKYSELEKKNAELSEKLADKRIDLNNAGSIAEASLQLSGIFEAAQEACRLYTDNIANLSARQEAVCAKREAESSLRAGRILSEAEAKSLALKLETESQCAEMLRTAREQSQAYWDKVYAKMQSYSAEHAELKELLSFSLKRKDNDQ